jgi:hypothetical protein
MHWILLFVLAGDFDGRWRSEVISRGGIGTLLEFQPGGELRVISAVNVLSAYAVEGTELVTPSGEVNGPPVRQVIDLRTPGLLRLWSGTKMNSEWRRVGQAREGILGEWLGRQEFNGHLLAPRMIFYENGQSLFVMALKTNAGKWKVTQNTIEITWPDGQVSRGTYQLTKGRLSLPGKANSESMVFTRY